MDIAQDLPAEDFAVLEPLDGFGIFADAFVFAVDELEGVHQVRAGDGGGGDGLEELGFFFFEVEGLVVLVFFWFGFVGFEG